MQAPWYQLAAEMVFRHMWLKGIGTMLFIAVFFGAYFYLLKRPPYPPAVMPVTWVDRLIPFQPSALLLYVSLWVYVSLPQTLMGTRRELSRYALVISGVCLSGLAVFYFWPTVVPPADIDWALYPEVKFLKELDASGNAFPSLHVATAIFSGIWLHHILRGFGSPGWVILLNALWCAGIVYSTLATRQHVAVDVVAGLVLGAVPAWISLRYHKNAGVSGGVPRP